MKKKILIITDQFFNSGNGNFIRSKELYSKLKLLYTCKLKIFKNLKKKEIYKYDLIILDLPRRYYKLDFLKKYKGIILSLDHHLKFKVFLNISLFKKSNYALYNKCDLKFSIIRDEIKKIRTNKVKNLIFISIGSTDILNNRYKIFNILKKNFNKIFLSKKIQNNKKIFKLHNKKFIYKMKECNLGISNGGTTMLELIYLKKIVIAVPQTEDEQNFIKHVKKKYKVFTNVNFKNKETLKKIMKSNQKIGPIDGNGCKHIISEIKTIFFKFKKIQI